jgi:SAM-dependent methyltransferase
LSRTFPTPAIRRKLSSARYAYQLRGVDPSRSPSENFAGCTDGQWLWANTAGARNSARLRGSLPTLPNPGLQRSTTGADGDATLREGYRFYRLVKQSADARHPGGFKACRDVVDFGCGWGRMARFFLKDVAPERLVGLDCVPAMVEAATATNRWSVFEAIGPLPPAPVEAASVDLIYAYSVFSHLSEEAHAKWLAEFRRILRPGGVAVLTTRARSFFADCERLRLEGAQDAPGRTAADAFGDASRWRPRYDAGEFCHASIGLSGALDDSFYGETAIPESYVRRVWSQWFDVMDWVDDRSRCAQAVAVLRRPDQ